MEDLIKRKCEEAGISPDVLTPEEIAQLEREIKIEQSGKMILDGVLSNPDIYYRGLKKHD